MSDEYGKGNKRIGNKKDYTKNTFRNEKNEKDKI
jgi:hypothetical protein